MTRSTYYITTPLYYANAEFHIGSAYTTIAADVMARYKRLCGYDVFFLTGTDEHGQKIKKAADAAGLSVRDFVDGNVRLAQKLWQDLDITFNHFIRTTDTEHAATVTELYNRIRAKGDIYEGQYQGAYCEGCERYYTDKELNDGKCPVLPEHRVDVVQEKNYFFRLSRYRDALLERMEKDPRFLMPEPRRNELLNRLRDGLDDISISRSALDWGIPVPDNPQQVLWVWFDALTNYITAIGFPRDMETFNKFWPADLHLMAKDIPWFHAVIWPAMLMSAGIEPARSVFAHGYWTIEGKKISKTLGNIVYPREITDVCGSDAFRYFMLREVPFGGDGDFKMKAMFDRYDGDLLKDFGNLENRATSMILRYFDGLIPAQGTPDALDNEVKSVAAQAVEKSLQRLENLEFSLALEEIWTLVRRLNKFADEREPWKLAKDPAKRELLEKTLAIMAEGLRIISLMITPFMPRTSKAAFEKLGLGDAPINLPGDLQWSNVLTGKRAQKGAVLFKQMVFDEASNTIKPKIV